MKKIFLFLLLAVISIGAMEARRTPGEKVGVEFKELIYDFGTVKAGDPSVTHEFEFTVTGSEPVSILSANASCGCTTPDYNRKPTMPGKSNAVKVSFSPKGQRGEMDKEVRLRLKNGAGKSESITLRLVGVVVPQ